jgi:hypothetical protein
MRTHLQDIHINQKDLDLFLTLNDKSKLEFLSDLQRVPKHISILKQLSKFKKRFDVEDDDIIFDRKIFKHKNSVVLVIVRNDILIISSNSKRAIKEVKWKFFGDGYMFSKRGNIKNLTYYKHTEFYKTMGILSPICLS